MKYGYEVVALSGELDPAKQNNQFSDFVAQGYNAIFLNPVDSKAAGEGVKKAHEAGIPVFTYDGSQCWGKAEHQKLKQRKLSQGHRIGRWQ